MLCTDTHLPLHSCLPLLQCEGLALHHTLQLHLLARIGHCALPAALLLCKTLWAPRRPQLGQCSLQHGWHHTLQGSNEAEPGIILGM
jgi:hypothetical protein